MERVELIRQELPYAVSEEIKSLRTNIQFCGADKKIILFTSAAANEGKSTIALEVSRSLASLGKRILLLDVDLRRSMLFKKVINPPVNSVGLSHYLSGQNGGNEVIYETETQGLYVAFAGPTPPNPSELLAHARMESLLNWARTAFDYIIVDAPPITLVTDTSVIAPLCDGAIFVIKEGIIPRKVAVNGMELLKRANCMVLGIVLNQVKMDSRGKYYYKHYYKKYYKNYEKEY